MASGANIQHIKHFDMSKAVDQAKDRVLEAAGIAVAGQAAQLIHNITGRLAGSISWAVRGKESGVNQFDSEGTAKPGDHVSTPTDKDECFVGTNVEYAEHLEYGTLRMQSGRPYLRPAVRVMKPKIKRYWENSMREVTRGK